jgi:serine protease AprX
LAKKSNGDKPPDPPKPGDPGQPDYRMSMGRATVPPGLHDGKSRAQWGLPESDQARGNYMVELNLLYKEGIQEATVQFLALNERILPSAPAPLPVSKTYFRCTLSADEWRTLIKADETAAAGDRRSILIYRIWPDFPIRPLVDHSVATVKGDAALRSYAASGEGIVWAVIDSGIEGKHRHFGDPADPAHPAHHILLHPDVAGLHRDFSGSGPVDKASIPTALTDGLGHGTHVAGIISGGLPKGLVAGKDFQVYERVFVSDPSGEGHSERLDPRMVTDPEKLHGVAPGCRLVSLRVLDDSGFGYSSNVMRALQYIREDLNGDPKMLRVHGVNLSIGYEFDAEMFACGQSPLCVEVDRLVRSGVVVVVAAGNTGYGTIQADQRPTKVGLANTINDPGNAALAITVGATHRDSPHTYGVSYFSSKGPTGDGRLKPDLVAPGERITSCAAGQKLASGGGDVPDGLPAYVDDTGTSMAAPHVSGAIAAFLSIRREFIQRPEEVKRIFLASATPLGRERYFEGNGLLDLMRAIQSV